MFRFLKWIFLIFGSLAIIIISFFVYQNRNDLSRAYEYSEKLSYDYQVKNCANEFGYNFPCFEKDFARYIEQTSLTGISIGLKLAFSYMDTEKSAVTMFSSEAEKNVVYAINYLKLNNIAIEQCDHYFYGFTYLYSGYLSSVRDFLVKSQIFSENLIKGLRSEEGIFLIKDDQKKDDLFNQVNALEAKLHTLIKEKTSSNNLKIQELLDKAAQAKK